MISTLKTKRLILRPLSISDQDTMVDTIMSDMDVGARTQWGTVAPYSLALLGDPSTQPFNYIS